MKTLAEIALALKKKGFEKVEMLPTEEHAVGVSTRICGGLNHEDVKNLMAIAEAHDARLTIFSAGYDGTSDLMAAIHRVGK